MASSRLLVAEQVRQALSARVLRVLDETAQGKNQQNIPFTFTHLTLPRGTKEHAPNADPEEVRFSITVTFHGTPTGTRTMHPFMDSTIKSPEDMHAGMQKRQEEDRRLLIQEERFPDLKQTPVRKQAHEDMMKVIRGLRDDAHSSMVHKLGEKANALRKYQTVLQEQQVARTQSLKWSEASPR